MAVIGRHEELPDDGILAVYLDRQHEQSNQKVLVLAGFGRGGGGLDRAKDLGLAGVAVVARGGGFEHLNWKIK